MSSPGRDSQEPTGTHDERAECPSCGLSLAEGTVLCPRDGTPILEPTAIRRNPLHTPSGVEGMEPTAVRDVLIGRRLGDYQVRRRIGNGGMGIVYEGVQPEIGRRVAIKILRPDLAPSAAALRGLLQEARAANAIRHRGIIDIYNFGELEGVGQYLVMEYLEGEALDELLARRQRLPLHEVLTILDQVLSALIAAHSAGVVHRDLKPSNIFLVPETGGSPYVKVLDFGLAKNQAAVAAVAQTQGSLMVGTPAYMAPEQALGRPVSPRTDLYAVGCVAFELLTGRRLFDGETPMAVAIRQVQESPPRLRELSPDAPAIVEAFISALLQKEPQLRPASAESARATLRGLIGELASAPTIGGAGPVRLPSEERTSEVELPLSVTAPGVSKDPRAAVETRLLPRPPVAEATDASALVPPARAPRSSRPFLLGGLVTFAAVGGLWLGWGALSGEEGRPPPSPHVAPTIASATPPPAVAPPPEAPVAVEAPLPPPVAPEQLAEEPAPATAGAAKDTRPTRRDRRRERRDEAKSAVIAAVAAAPKETGLLKVIVSPYLADLIVDGVNRGRHRGNVLELPAGEHELTLVPHGGKYEADPLTRRVRISAREQTTLTFQVDETSGRARFIETGSR